MFKNTSSFPSCVTVMLLMASSLVAAAPLDDVTLLEQNNNNNNNNTTSRHIWNTGIGNDLCADSCDFPSATPFRQMMLPNAVKKCYDFISPQRGWCTHFTMIFTSSSSDWCLFKFIHTGMVEKVDNEMISGFIPVRSAQSTSA